MSPTPLIELQRRLTLVGAIRAGGEKPERGVGRKLEAWRVTSARRELIEQVATLYGGEVTPWQSPVGPEFQCYTTAPDLPVLVMPNFSLRQTYELWEGATKRTRLCDGVDEELSGGPCICNAEGVDKCDLYSRLVVVLPEVGTLHGWRLITRGANAAHELPTMLAIAQQAGRGAPFIPARMRIAQRRGVVDGQVARFVVPTLDLDVSYLALAAPVVDGSMAALPPPTGFAPSREPTVEQALSAVADPSPAPRTTRSAAAFGPDDVDTSSVTAPTVPDDSPEQQQQTAKLHKDEPMWRKLNVLVGTLREAGHVTTDGLYDAVATRLRGTAGLDLALTLGGYDEEHVLHWSPLRDSLTRSEAHQLIEWLVKLEARVAAESGAGEQPAAQASAPDADVEPPPQGSTGVPYNEFPPGY